MRLQKNAYFFSPVITEQTSNVSAFHAAHLSQVFLGLAEPLRTIHAVLNATAVDGVVVLVVQQQRSNDDHVRTVGHRVTEIAQLTVIAGHDSF